MSDVFEPSGAQSFDLPLTGEHRQCPHGFHHPPWPHSCDGCWCEGESDRKNYGWDHDTSPRPAPIQPVTDQHVVDSADKTRAPWRS